MGTFATDDPDSTVPSTGRTSRRTVLLGAGGIGAAAAAAALAGCGSSDSGSTNTAGGNSGSSTAGGANIAKSADIPVGGGKIFGKQKVVVTQPTAGTFKAFSSICTHQGCQVGSITDGVIMCPCHGSEYSITDGSVKRAAVPGQAALPAKQVTVSGGEVSVS